MNPSDLKFNLPQKAGICESCGSRDDCLVSFKLTEHYENQRHFGNDYSESYPFAWEESFIKDPVFDEDGVITWCHSYWSIV